MRAVNTANYNELASDLVLAESFITRLRGLIGRKNIDSGEGLWINPCKGVHTFGMRFPIDVVFLDTQLHIIAIAQSMEPNRLTRQYMQAASAMELPSGTVANTATKTGDLISII